MRYYANPTGCAQGQVWTCLDIVTSDEAGNGSFVTDQIVGPLTVSGPWPIDTRLLNDAIAARLKALALEAEALGAQLCSDEYVMQEHLVTLQDIDRFSQNLNAIGTIIQSDDVAEAIAGVSLLDLRNYLRDALQTDATPEMP